MDDSEVTARGERFHIAERSSGGVDATYDITWLSAPGSDVRGLTVAGGGLTREQLIKEALNYAESEREEHTPKAP
ncbi:hypothetical protein ITJ42_16160 [Clavibacter michiganensis subsp. phaseoli]|uniref:Uncharacterized protein n=1 Tax=Clavibacter phaseoli TaxID=1734031 RepID=A0A8I0S9T9_9MICO|nr:hypothetical protein [Clavibacter phaseoli]MBF4632754.1 hypothetical protein [Clavibacter phaseoli]